MLVLPFHRGRLFSGDEDGCNELRRDAGVGVYAGLGDGAVMDGGLGMADFLLVAEGVG